MSAWEMVLSMIGIGIQILDAKFKNNPTDVENLILKMVSLGHGAYKAQTGKDIDPSLIKPIEHV